MLGALVLTTVVVIGSVPGARAAEPGALTDLVAAAAERLQTADPVAASKWLTNANIEDPQRVAEVLATVTAQAVATGVDADYVRQVFSDQIAATEAIQHSRFAQWKLDPAAAPAAAPDLSASRAAIDALNRQMVAEIAARWQLLRSPDCAGARDEAVAVVADARRLDALYRQALGFATGSYCSG